MSGKRRSGLSKKSDYDMNQVENILDQIDKDVIDHEYTSSTNVIHEQHYIVGELSEEEQLDIQKWVKFNDLEIQMMEGVNKTRKLKRDIQNRILKRMSEKHISTIKVGNATLKYEVTQRTRPLTLDHIATNLSKVITDPTKVDKIIQVIDRSRGTTTTKRLTRISD